MRVLCEITQEKEEQPLDGDIAYEKSQWWLMHWGIEFKMMETEQGLVPVNYTVAICENYETGQIETFMPGQLKIIGKEIK